MSAPVRSTPAFLTPQWPSPPRVRAVVTQRAGGFSAGAYASFNLAAHVGDAPERVAANRRRLIEGVGLPQAPRWLEQVHGTTVVELNGTEGGGTADAAVTGRPGVVCAVLTADCLPVLLCDDRGTRVGVVHAGWRGLAAGILPAAVRAMGVPPGQLMAWLGPAIGADAYEVGDEVRAAFARQRGATAAFEPNTRNRWQADLYALARGSLAEAGIAAVHGGGFCTYRDAEHFFSHRREAPCGRMATLIWLEAAGRHQTILTGPG